MKDMAALGDPLTKGFLTAQEIQNLFETFRSKPSNIQAMNAVCNTPVKKFAQDRAHTVTINNTFSVQLPENPATSQMKSGRCWMFAALNTFRSVAQERLGVSNSFEFSQNYTMFWDKLEKANYFLANIIETANEPTGSRLLNYLLQSPVQDGGQWDMFVNLIEKYGLVPKEVMPETDSSSDTGMLDNLLTNQLRAGAVRLRKAIHAGESTAKVEAIKAEVVQQSFNMLCIHLGTPPKQFDWQYRKEDKSFVREEGLTPRKFYDMAVAIDLSDTVCLIHDPRPEHPENRLYTVKYLGNMVGGKRIEYLNTNLDTMKAAAIAQLQSKAPVWFGCDVGRFLERDLGVMDTRLFNFELAYGEFHDLTKAERLHYGDSQMTHAMVFTGVDLDAKQRPLKWRVENSWSEKSGNKGYFQMSDPWFDEFNYEVVVFKKFVPKELLAQLEKEPIELEPWDPMGSLA